MPKNQFIFTPIAVPDMQGCHLECNNIILKMRKVAKFFNSLTILWSGYFSPRGCVKLTLIWWPELARRQDSHNLLKRHFHFRVQFYVMSTEHPVHGQAQSYSGIAPFRAALFVSAQNESSLFSAHEMSKGRNKLLLPARPPARARGRNLESRVRRRSKR